MGTLHLIDRVEWDLTSSLSPEKFAQQTCTDLGLGGEAQMLISHAVHEELLRTKRDCLELGLVGKLIDSGGASGRERGAKKLESVWRDWNEAKLFGPHLEILSAEAIVSCFTGLTKTAVGNRAARLTILPPRRTRSNA